MEDDKRFFPQNNAAITMRQDFYERYPQIAEVLVPVAEALTIDTMIELEQAGGRRRQGRGQGRAGLDGRTGLHQGRLNPPAT